MNLHILQHVPFEDPADITYWARMKGFPISTTRMFLGDSFPKLDDFDFLVVMGGPMNIYEEWKYPWLHEEKKLIERAIKKKKALLGICLGAQLIADVLGARVFKNEFKEIGWFPVELTKEAGESHLFKTFSRTFPAFHWHGDTFEMPKNALRISKSEGCANQAFEYEKRVVGLQFHLESTRESVQRLITNCREDMSRGLYVQTPQEIFSSNQPFEEIPFLVTKLLDQLISVLK